MNIDTEQIAYFLEVARLLNFTKAADILYLSQSAVSRKVSALEAQLNVKLIERGKCELKLTAAGEDFQKFFQEYLTRLLALQRMHSNVIEGRISFGIFHGCSLMDSMGGFISKFQSDNLDFVIGLKEPFEICEDFFVVGICEVHRTVIFSIKNPLAEKNELKLKDFEGQTYYAFVYAKNYNELRTIEPLTARLLFSV